ncbi:4Fe-4S dicluster domain-containing protein [bacterium]|nr:4Fe-4S dicluster domain-containing protein [bacterium]
MSYGMLFDVTRCVGCLACEAACDEANGNHPPEDVRDLRYDKWTVVRTVEVDGEEKHVRRMCMHCQDPSCVSVCPVGAFKKTELGPVIYDENRCMGCRYCMMACPYNVPTYEWDNPTTPRVRKCIMCYERVKAGEPTACAAACPAEATVFGKREDLLAEAHKRIAENPELYYPHVFGEHEAGGSSVLFLADKNFAALGLPGNLPEGPLPELTGQVLHRLPNVVVTAGAALMGLWWIIHRRQELAASPEKK